MTPRPIALVTTRSAAGTDNAAPISFFQVLAEEPPIVALSFNLRSDGTLKDTALAIAETGEFVVNLVDEGLVAGMNICAAEFPPGESEIPAAGLTLLPCTGVAPGRIAEAPASLGCRTHTVLDLSPERRIVLGQVVSLHARDDLFTPDGRHLREGAFLPVGRLYGGTSTPAPATASRCPGSRSRTRRGAEHSCRRDAAEFLAASPLPPTRDLRMR